MWTPEHQAAVEPRWRTVDRALRAIKQRRAALDADEARWLREAEALQIWHPLGMVSALDYLERVLGYAPRSAQDRLRIARALGDLPELTAALSSGELPFSAIRELTRVATPATEAAWVAAATGKNLRQIEELVSDHRPGDHPDDPPDPEDAIGRVTRAGLSTRISRSQPRTRRVELTRPVMVACDRSPPAHVGACAGPVVAAPARAVARLRSVLAEPTSM